MKSCLLAFRTFSLMDDVHQLTYLNYFDVI